MAKIQSELIATENLDPKEAMVMKNANPDRCYRDTEDLLKKLNYTLETIPEMGDVVYLKSTAN
jgi:cyanophycin synthetase